MVHILSRYRILALAGALFLYTGQLHAKLNVLACEPEWAALVIEIGGAHVNVNSVTTAMQDPHHVQARPSLIAKARKADLLVCSGAGLEAGWLPVLIRKSANPKIRKGKPGHILATDHIELLGKQTADKTGIHAKGNPHVHFDPQKMLRIAQIIKKALSTIDSDNADDYQDSFNQFEKEWRDAIAGWQQQAIALKDKPVIVHHDSWIYLFQWLGINQIATLEPRHGVPPSSHYLSSLLGTLKTQPADLIVRSGYEDMRPSQWLSEKSGIPVVTVPFSVTNYSKPGSLKQWMDQVISIISQEQ